MAINDDFEKAIKDIQGLPEMPSNQDMNAYLDQWIGLDDLVRGGDHSSRFLTGR